MTTPTADEQLRLKFSYDPSTGYISRNTLMPDQRHTDKFCKWYNKKSAGVIHGYLDTGGYLVADITINGKRYMRTFHRLGWFLHHGHWPVNQLDHINGCRHDNSLANLREVTHKENHQNRSSYVMGEPNGVFYMENCDKWAVYRTKRAKIKQHYAYCDTLEGASNVLSNLLAGVYKTNRYIT
jgi:hypothetical protein